MSLTSSVNRSVFFCVRPNVAMRNGLINKFATIREPCSKTSIVCVNFGSQRDDHATQLRQVAISKTGS